MQLTKIFTKTIKPAVQRGYLESCIDACATTEGASMLVARLTRDRDATPRSNPFHHMFQAQIDAALHAAEHVKVMHDVEVRIPDALSRAEAAAQAVKKRAKSESTDGAKALDAAVARLAGFKSQLETLQSQRDGIEAQAAQALDAARQALETARAAEDIKAIDRAADDLAVVRAAQNAKPTGFEALELRISALGSLVQKADTERQQAQALIESGGTLQLESDASLAAVAADRATLAALLAHVRWRSLIETLPGSPFPSGVNGVSFFFHDAANGPLWDGKGVGARAITTWPLQRIRFAMREPDFSVFATDPAACTTAAQPSAHAGASV